jgi:glycosyltransferase involved in cell wall biosynthesis
MRVYGQLVFDALEASRPHDIAIRHCPLYDPNGGDSMWRHHAWRLRHVRDRLRRTPGDLYHVLDGSMAGFIPRHYLNQTLVTVHDLIPVLQARGPLPAKPSLPARLLIHRSLAALRRCRALCADSDWSKKDMATFTGRTDAATIPLAIRPLLASKGAVALDLPDPYILHVGNNAAYKNRLGVLEVFARLADIPGLHLVMAGPPPTSDMLHRAHAVRRVLFINDATDAVLATLYRRAGLLLFPSLYEGFGMPVLEAMAAGCPVVCSTAGSLPEVAGGAALMASPEDVHALAAHCRCLLLDNAQRGAMIAKGRIRASSFTLEKMGAELVKWYKESAGR